MYLSRYDQYLSPQHRNCIVDSKLSFIGKSITDMFIRNSNNQRCAVYFTKKKKMCSVLKFPYESFIKIQKNKKQKSVTKHSTIDFSKPSAELLFAWKSIKEIHREHLSSPVMTIKCL